MDMANFVGYLIRVLRPKGVLSVDLDDYFVLRIALKVNYWAVVTLQNQNLLCG